MKKFVAHFIVRHWKWFIRREGNVIKIRALWGDVTVVEFETVVSNRVWK